MIQLDKQLREIMEILIMETLLKQRTSNKRSEKPTNQQNFKYSIYEKDFALHLYNIGIRKNRMRERRYIHKGNLKFSRINLVNSEKVECKLS